MNIPLTPVAKPRMSARDRWAKRPVVLRYFGFADELRAYWGEREPGPALSLRFYLPMPKSWSNKKKLAMLGAPHQQKPDIDNLIKAVMDALYEDDSIVHSVRAEKFWSESGMLEIEETDPLA